MTDPVTDFVQVVAHEREGRDRGWWEQMACCYHRDSRVRSMWFTGTGEDFAAASRVMAERGDHARHRLSMPMAIELRIDIRGIEADLVSYARGIYRMERHDGQPKICDLSTIYERDTLTAVVPGSSLSLDHDRLAAMPASYRMLAYYFDLRGYPADPGLPGDDQTALAGALLTEAFDWLVD